MDAPARAVELRGARVALRTAREDDVEAIVEVLREPSVARWWGPYDAARVRRDLAGDFETLVIELEGAVIGLMMIAEETDPDYRHAGLDIAVAGPHQGRGLGSEALRLAIDHLIDERGHHRITIDPATANERAIRVYRGVGFRPVGVMREYERAADGTWRDGLLMDLLARERAAGRAAT